MIQAIISAATFLAAVCSALAAYHWFQASRVEAPETLIGTAPFDLEIAPIGSQVDVVVDTKPLVEYARESAKRNKVAALWSATAATCAGLAWALGLFNSHA